MEPVGQGIEVFEAGAPQHAHPARGVAHRALRERAEQEREQEVARAAQRRHAALGAHPRAQRDVGAAVLERPAQVREEARVAGAVGVQEGQQLAARVREAALDGGAVAAVAVEGEDRHLREAERDLLGAVGRAVAHDQDLDLVHAARGDDVRAGVEAAAQGAPERLLLVERRDDDAEHAVRHPAHPTSTRGTREPTRTISS